jgi:signal peptidase I
MRTGQRAVLAIVGLCLALASLGALSGRTGGPITWVITAGTSMQPEINPGTLVVVQRKPSYEVGDVVAYRSSQLGQTVLHRVVEVDGSALVLKGDANSWLDPVSPDPADVLGERTLQIPGAGQVLKLFQNPLALGVLAAVAAGALLPRSGSTSRRRRLPSVRSSRSPRERTPKVAPGSAAFVLPTSGPTWTPEPEPEPASEQPRPRQSVLVAAGDDGFLTLPGPLRVSPAVETAVAAAAGFFLLLGALATAGPFVERTDAGRSAEHAVSWSYGASVVPGVVYPDGEVLTGDTLYTRLVDDADVAAELRLTVPRGVQVEGSWRLAVIVDDESGWKQQTYLGRPTPVSGPAQSLSVRVPTADLLDLARRASQESGVESSARRLTVQALLDLTAEADGVRQPVAAAPALVFNADDRQIRLADPTQLEQRGEVALPPAAQPTVLSLLGVTVPAPQARLVALAGGLLSLLVLALLRGARRSDDEDARISRVAGELLIPVTDLDEPDRTVDLPSFEALAAIAARYERMVLFGDHDGLRVYLVLDDGVAYRYYSAAAAAALEASAPAPAPHPDTSWTMPQQRDGEPDLARS